MSPSSKAAPLRRTGIRLPPVTFLCLWHGIGMTQQYAKLILLWLRFGGQRGVQRWR